MMIEGKAKHSQDNPRPHAGLALLERDLPTVEARAARDEDGEPAEGESNVCMRMDLLEEVGSGEELGGGTRVRARGDGRLAAVGRGGREEPSRRARLRRLWMRPDTRKVHVSRYMRHGQRGQTREWWSTTVARHRKPKGHYPLYARSRTPQGI